MERPAWLLTVKFDSCNNLYHPFILIVSFCVLSGLIIKYENIIIIIGPPIPEGARSQRAPDPRGPQKSKTIFLCCKNDFLYFTYSCSNFKIFPLLHIKRRCSGLELGER